MNSSRRPSLTRLITEGGTPFTRIVVACYALTFLTEWLLAAASRPHDWLFKLTTFIAPESLRQPWTLLTYAFATYAFTSSDIIWAIFNALFMLFVGASLERSWGARTFAVFFLAMAAVTALGFAVGAYLTHTLVIVPAGLVLGALFVGFAILNPDVTINLYCLLPVKTRWLMWAEIAIIFFTYGRGNPLLGVFALSGCAAAWLWVRNLRWANAFLSDTEPPRFTIPRTSFTPRNARSGGRRDDDFSWRDLNPFERMARARRKKQFERLFEDDKDYKS